MHVTSLIITYTVGIKENTRTRKEIRDGKEIKVTEIVTPGGALPDGARIIKTLRSFVNFWTASPQRKDKLRKIVDIYDLPEVALQNYPDTRVAFACKLMLSAMVNYFAMSRVEDNDWAKLWKNLSEDDWKTVQEMEALILAMGVCAVTVVQKSSVD